MELKTLKELTYADFYCNKCSYSISGPHAVERKRLKEEAIKWVKSDSVEGAYPDEGLSAYDFIKEFFNITEEDLK